ncbi:MAG: YfhO family protein [Elusimicrobia bacterium]|nr:YfhO family protein [Elusimicrobiota bacterium]
MAAPPRRTTLYWASASAALALIGPALLRGEGLLATAALWRVPPWNAVLPPRLGAGLLADQLLYLAPWRQFMREGFLAWDLPLWNPFILAGVPFAACIQAAPFHPLNAGLLWLPAVPFTLVSAFLKLFCAGVFTGLHLRRLGASERGCVLGAVVFSLGGFMVAWLGHPHSTTACLLPALFWALGRLSDRPGSREAALLALFTGLALLGGHPPTMLHVLGAAAAYGLFLSAGRPRFLVWAALGAALGACLAAPALLPYFEYAGLSSTAAASGSLARWGFRLSPWLPLHLLMPLASGSPARGAEILAGLFGLGPESNFIERAAWTGLIPLAFAALAVARRRDGQTLFHLGLALFGLSAALGAPPLPWLWKALPAFSAANPTRLLLVWTFGVAVLAGLGADADPARLEPAVRRVLRWSLWVPSVLALSAYWILAWRSLDELRPSEVLFAVAVMAVFLAECLAARRLLDPRRRAWTPWLAGLFCLIPALDVNPSAPASTFYPETPAITALRDAAGEGRVFALGRALEPNLGMPFRLRDARGRDFTAPRRYEELVTGRAGDFDFYSGAAEPPPNPTLLAVGAVGATARTASAAPKGWKPVHEGDLLVFRAPAPARRALFVAEARTAAPAEVLAAVRAPGFDPARMVWLDDGDAPAFKAAKGAARIAADGADSVVVEVDAGGPGWLVLLDNWYPGWEAAVDGRPARVRRADYAFRAVEVPAGKSVVRFDYRPRPFRLGLLLALLAAPALLAAALL